MKTSILGAVVLASLAAAYGCSSQADSTPPDQSEDRIGLVSGKVDHAAIVEITTMMLIKTPTNAPPLDSALDPFNESDPFHLSAGTYQAQFAENLGKFDAYDGKQDWTDAQAATWTSRVGSGNFLVLDTSKPCNFDDPHTYLEIERAQLTGQDHATCGGRMPNEDAFDVTANFLARGPGASVSDDDAVTDGVDQATQRSAAQFPFLADIN
jgi:hypothetical protein